MVANVKEGFIKMFMKKKLSFLCYMKLLAVFYYERFVVLVLFLLP